MQDILLLFDPIRRIFLYRQDIPLLLDSIQYFTFHKITQTNLLCLSPVPHLNTIKVLLTYFQKGSSLNTIQSHAPIVQLHLHYPNTQFQRPDCLKLYMVVSNTHRIIPNYVTLRKATPASVEPPNSAHSGAMHTFCNKLGHCIQLLLCFPSAVNKTTYSQALQGVL